MANIILAVPEQYHLPKAARDAIRAQVSNSNSRTPDAALAALIERQRARFIDLHGNDGLEP